MYNMFVDDDNKIETLCVSDDTIRILKENDINYISQLNNKTKKELTNMGIAEKEISIIAIKIEFKGFRIKDLYEIDSEEGRDAEEKIYNEIKESLYEFLEEEKKS